MMKKMTDDYDDDDDDSGDYNHINVKENLTTQLAWEEWIKGEQDCRKYENEEANLESSIFLALSKWKLSAKSVWCVNIL